MPEKNNRQCDAYWIIHNAKSLQRVAMDLVAKLSEPFGSGSLLFLPVARVGAGQAAQRQQPRHEAEIGVYFAGSDKLVHLVSLGEVPLCRWRGPADRLHRSAQTGQGFPK